MRVDFSNWRSRVALAAFSAVAFFAGRSLPALGGRQPAPAAPTAVPASADQSRGAATSGASSTPALLQTAVDPFSFLRRPAPAPLDPRAERLARLQAVLDEEAQLVPGRLSVHVRLADGGEAGVNAYQPLEGASLIKVPVMAALYAAWDAGFVPRTEEDEQRLRGMITRSRNIPTNELIEKLGMERINAWLAANGYGSTGILDRILDPSPIGHNQVTAADMTRMLEQITRGELVSQNASREMRKLLLAQRWRDRIPAGIPDEAVVGNKTGTLSVVLHDMAFVEPPDGPSYTVAVLIERPSRAEVKAETIERISRRIYYTIVGIRPPLTGHRQEWPRPNHLQHRLG